MNILRPSVTRVALFAALLAAPLSLGACASGNNQSQASSIGTMIVHGDISTGDVRAAWAIEDFDGTATFVCDYVPLSEAATQAGSVSFKVVGQDGSDLGEVSFASEAGHIEQVLTAVSPEACKDATVELQTAFTASE